MDSSERVKEDVRLTEEKHICVKEEKKKRGKMCEWKSKKKGEKDFCRTEGNDKEEMDA